MARAQGSRAPRISGLVVVCFVGLIPTLTKHFGGGLIGATLSGALLGLAVGLVAMLTMFVVERVSVGRQSRRN